MSHGKVESSEHAEFAEEGVCEKETADDICELDEKLKASIESDNEVSFIQNDPNPSIDKNESKKQTEDVSLPGDGDVSCDATNRSAHDIVKLVTHVPDKEGTTSFHEEPHSSSTQESTLEKPDTLVLRRASEKLHSPFYWQVDLNIRSYGNHEIDLLTEFGEMFQETSFTFRRFTISLIKCYHNFFKRLMHDSKKNLEEMERMLSFTSRKECPDVLFNTIKTALLHVSHSCRVYILEKTNQIEKASQILKKIEPYESMTNSNKAGVWGIRAAVYVEYGYEGVKKAIEYVGKAIELDSKNAYWHFFKGVYLGRLRRMNKGPVTPTEEEINCLESAMKKLKDPAFYAFTAEVYVDNWKAVEKCLKQNKIPTTDDMKEKLSQYLEKCKSIAAKYFRESVKMRSNSAHLLFRCGKGLMRLPPPHGDLEEARKYLENGLELSPESSFGNHAMATFTMKHMKNNEQAKEYLINSVKRGNFQAHMDLCRLTYLENRNAEDLASSLAEMLKLYGENPKRCKILGELIICHLFLVYDLEEACACATHLIELLSELPGSWIDYINDFNSGLVPFSQNVPLVELLLSETGNQFHRKDITEKEKNVYKKFVHFIIAQPCSKLPNPPKNIWSIYEQDLKQALRKQSNFIESCGAEKKCLSEEKLQVAHLKTSSDNEYRKYYGHHKEKTVGDILRPRTSDDSDHEKQYSRERRKGKKSDGENGRSERLRRNEKSPRRGKPDPPESPSKRVTNDLAVLAIDKTKSHEEAKSDKVEPHFAKSNDDSSRGRSQKYKKNDSHEHSEKGSHLRAMKGIVRRDRNSDDSDSSAEKNPVLGGNEERSPDSDVSRRTLKSRRHRRYSGSSSSPHRDSRRFDKYMKEYKTTRDRKYRDRSSSAVYGDKSRRSERRENEDCSQSSSSGQSNRKYRREREKRSYSPTHYPRNRRYKSRYTSTSESDSDDSTITHKHRTRSYSSSGSDEESRYRRKHRHSPHRRGSHCRRSYREDEKKYRDDNRRESGQKHSHQRDRDR